MKKNGRRILVLLFWILVWEAVSLIADQEIFLVSPHRVLLHLFSILPTADFWRAVFFSFLRISLGYWLAVLAGVFLAGIAAGFSFCREILSPLIHTIRSVPVASFIILVLICLPSRMLSVLIAFLIVLPVIYENTLKGIGETDVRMLEMAEIFRISLYRRIRYIYTPSVEPYLLTACTAAMGMAWKAGTAAEVIGITGGSVGERLQQAKTYIDTPEVFAWTIVIILLSLLSERIMRLVLKEIFRIAGQGRSHEKYRKEQSRSSRLHDTGNEKEICIRGISKAYDGISVLKSLSCSFSAGEKTALMAPSGAGKTTLLRILSGLENADEGAVSGLEGRKIGILFQEDRLCEHMSAEGNLLLVSPFLQTGEIRKAFSAVGLDPKVCMGRSSVKTFSGGMKRRVSLLRALLSDWDVLLLDEPFKGLDEKNRSLTADFINRETRGRTVLVITHAGEEVQLLDCSKVLSLNFEKKD